jgi:hypothetical protein
MSEARVRSSRSQADGGACVVTSSSSTTTSSGHGRQRDDHLDDNTSRSSVRRAPPRRASAAQNPSDPRQHRVDPNDHYRLELPLAGTRYAPRSRSRQPGRGPATQRARRPRPYRRRRGGRDPYPVAPVTGGRFVDLRQTLAPRISDARRESRFVAERAIEHLAEVDGAHIAGYGVSSFAHEPGVMCAAVFAGEWAMCAW